MILDAPSVLRYRVAYCNMQALFVSPLRLVACLTQLDADWEATRESTIVPDIGREQAD